jgi:hypothetical protein
MSNDKVKIPTITRPTGLVNLSAKYPVYHGGDARTAKPGTEGPPIHGHVCGLIDLPTTIVDKTTGEKKPWRAFVIELLQPAPVMMPDSEEITVATKGMRILLTETIVLERWAAVANNPEFVYEVYIVPQVGKTAGGQSLWEYPTFEVGKPIKREPRHQVSLLLPTPTPAGLANGATA